MDNARPFSQVPGSVEFPGSYSYSQGMSVSYHIILEKSRPIVANFKKGHKKECNYVKTEPILMYLYISQENK
jgi:hypothetical protein